MEQKIIWLTEGGHKGKIPRNFRGMRNDSAWMCTLNAIHYPIWEAHAIHETYDLAIVTLPKKNIDKLMQYPLMESLRKCCNKIAYMQEGPHWYFQDYPLDQQCWFYNTLMEMDWLYVHNKSDINYYQGLTGKECRLMPTLMIEDNVKELTEVERSGVMMGGNFCNWYGGFDSYMVAQEFDAEIFVPSMGRRIEGEEQMPGLNHLPYMDWTAWIGELNKRKYGIHLMRTHAAGTFALNCAYLGIPCIGYHGLDTQEICHPDLTIQFGDIISAKKLAEKLRNDEDFYLYCSKVAKMLYEEHYTESIFTKKWNR